MSKIKKQQKENVPSLASRAMLVNLSIGFWNGRKKDRAVGEELTENKLASAEAGDWFTRVVPKKALKSVMSARSAARASHLLYTLPWNDDGQRILPADAFLKYTEVLRAAKVNYQKAVEGFLAEYPDHVKSAPARLGQLFKDKFLPSVDALAARFPFDIAFSPVPVASDFRVDLGEEVNEEIKQGIEDRTKEMFANANADLWERLYTHVNHIVDRLSNPDTTFKDSLIENTIEVCDLLPKLNVTGDENLERLRKEVVEKLTIHQPENLRRNKVQRADVAKEANSILNKLKEYIGNPDDL